MLPAFRYLEQVHSRPTDVLEASGLTALDMTDHQRRIPQPQANAFLRQGALATGDPLFALRSSQAFDRGNLSLGQVLISVQPTGAEAFKRASRFASLQLDALTLHLGRSGKKAVCSLAVLGAPIRPGPMAEYILGLLVSLGREVVIPDLRITHLEFAHRSMAPLEDYAAILPHRLRFQASRTAAVFSDSNPDAPLRTADPVLAELLEEQANLRLATLPVGRNIRQRTASWLQFRLGQGPVGIRDAADAFHMSERTLRRRLGDNGITYSALLDAARRTHCMELIVDPNLNLDEISVALGFSTTSSLRRAFHRWVGVNPREYRRGLR